MPNQMKRENMRSFGAPMGAPRPQIGVDPTRQTAQPPDPAVVRQAMNQSMANRQARTGAVPPLRVKPPGSDAGQQGPNTPATQNPTRDLSLQHAAQTITARPAVINQAVDDAQK